MTNIIAQLPTLTNALTQEQVADLLKETTLPITREDLEVVLQNNLRPGASFLTIVAKTVPDINLTDGKGNSIPDEWRTDLGRGKDKIWHLHKVATVNCMVCADYAKRVNKVRESLGLPVDFRADLMTWGQHRSVPYDVGEKSTCLVDHYYVDCPTPKCKHKYDKSFDVKECPLCHKPRLSAVFLYVFPLHSLNYYYQLDNGTYIDPSIVHQFGKEWKEGKQGLDEAHEIRVRKYNLDNIQRLSANAKIYDVSAAQQHLAAA